MTETFWDAAPLAPPLGDHRLELWGGIECTVNRVGDRWFDQVERSGHVHRLDDLDRFAELGLRTLRYPILWERTAPHGLDRADWRWPDERLGRLRELGIRPIVGLLHHGNGPPPLSLLDPGFPDAFAAYAVAVARRYPWLDTYAPINEPQVTARFAGLYGLWYPHGHDPATFARILVNQCRGIALAMQAIRQVNPDARLVQTDDLGKTFARPHLAYQADFDNERRWLTFDLLMGRLERQHPLWGYLTDLGISEAELGWFTDHPCPPDIVGVDYYLTSERFLDERLERYPPQLHGGNGRDEYADLEVVRVAAEGLSGPAAHLYEAWQRCERPVAITEAHNGCTREEQLRWLWDVWRSAEAAQAAGADVRAVTVWGLLGLYDWNTLVTEDRGYYEPGAYDLRAPRPRPTALAHLVRDLAHGCPPDYPVLAVPGWWRRPQRLLYPPVARAWDATAGRECPLPPIVGRPRPLLITDATSALGRATVRLCEMRGLVYVALGDAVLDVADVAAVDQTLRRLRPWAVFNATLASDPALADTDPSPGRRRQVDGPRVLAEACARHGTRLVTLSSDLVFDGDKGAPYVESDAPCPTSLMGEGYAEAEAAVLAALPIALIVRSAAVFGPWDEDNFVARALQSLMARETVAAPDDLTLSPTYNVDLIQASLDLLIDGESGVWHLANPGAVSPLDLTREAARAVGLDPAAVSPQPARELPWAARRPRYSVLGSQRGVLLPPLADALARLAHDRAL